MTFSRLTIACAFSVFGLYLLLVTGLLGFTDPTRFLTILGTDRVLYSIRLSVSAALLATFLSMCFAIPAGYALSRYEFRGKKLV
ncbi:MAG TPA: ABC transporter permease, partial [Candidatus Ozemobacteraceae bacterium]|nr:ABC transporter permease [Candidatus Ozemobacteraceae bacterium]